MNSRDLGIASMGSFFILLVLCCDSKQPDYLAHISDSKVKSVISKSIEFSGGMAAWLAIESFHYNKEFSLYDQNDLIEKDFVQRHEYNYDPINITIKSIEAEDTLLTTFNGKNYQRHKNDTLLDISSDLLRKAVNTSLYVIGMPFKLSDAGVELSYQGIDTLPNGLAADVIQATYAPDKFTNHSTPDIWKYYFDLTDYRIIANSVKTVDHDALILNETFERVNGILVNRSRKSYRLKENEQIDYLRASYDYHGYAIKFKQ